jgi:protein TonB
MTYRTGVLLFFVMSIALAASAQEITKDGATLPVVVREVKPDYTDEAKKAGIQGDIWLSVVVQADGTVGNVQVKRSLDTRFGLDEQAVIAAKQWKFKPGTKNGKAVAVEVTVEMTFRLK